MPHAGCRDARVGTRGIDQSIDQIPRIFTRATFLQFMGLFAGQSSLLVGPG
jgi:hypothetical protein